MKSAYLFSTIVVATLILSGQPAWTQATAGQDEPRQVVISIYHIAPGKHVDFLKWMAAREAVSEAAGVAPTQWYVHVDGDSWDYVAISPDLSDEQQDKVNADFARNRAKLDNADFVNNARSQTGERSCVATASCRPC